MKKFKFMSVVASILAVVLLAGCGSDERAPYIEALEEADQTSIAGLGTWLGEHRERIDELFEIDEVHVDLEGDELEWEQVRNFDDEFLDHWSFEADGEDITITFVWDVEAATANPFATERAALVEWFDVVIEMMEEIDVERPLMFLATLGGFLTGTNSALEDGTISGYVRVPIENTISSIQEVHDLVLQDFDEPDLDLVEIRDITIGFLTDMQEIFID